MKRFELLTPTRVKLTKATPRKEFAGDERRQAISLRVQLHCSAEKLAELHPNLQDMLFWRPPQLEAQQQIDGVPEVKPNLRAPVVKQPLHLELDLSGYTINIVHGVDDDLELYQCELAKFDVEGIEGGSCKISWSIASNKEITPELVGKLCDLEGGEVEITQNGPEVQQAPIDGTVEAFKKEHPDAGKDAGDLFAAAHGEAEELETD